MKQPLRRFKFTEQETRYLILAIDNALTQQISEIERTAFEKLTTKLSEPKSMGYARSIIKRAIKNKGGKVSDYKSEAITEAAKNLMEGKND